MTEYNGAGAYCPCANPDEPGAHVLGLRGGTPENPTVVYLSEPVLVTAELLRELGDTPAGDVLRIAAPCRESACSHFRDSHCSLITKIARAAPEAISDAPLPQCNLRPRCRWWHQEKVAACRRCPAILTDNAYADELELWVADPANSAEEFDPRNFPASRASGDTGPRSGNRT
jgi:hypothetical protein